MEYLLILNKTGKLLLLLFTYGTLAATGVLIVAQLVHACKDAKHDEPLPIKDKYKGEIV